MKKNVVDFLEAESNIERKYYPVDIYFVKKIHVDKESDDLSDTKFDAPKPIEIGSIRFKGNQRLVPYSPISLILKPIENKKYD